MVKRKEILAMFGLVTLIAANAAAYALVNFLVRKYDDANIPPLNPIRLPLVAAFVTTTFLAVIIAVFAATTLSPKKRLSRLAIGAASILFFSVALVSVPISSTDNAWNVLMARNMVIHGRNPYVTPAGTFTDDPAYHADWSRWYDTPMVYGPLWTALSALPVLIVSDPGVQAKGMLILNLSGYVLAGYILYRWMRKRDAQKAWLILVFWLLNPVAAFEIANAGHNEGAMLPFLAILATALVDENLELAAAGIVGAALIKHWPLVLAPALLAIPAKNRKRLLVIGASLSALVLVWWPFWAGKATFAGMAEIANNISDVINYSPFRFVLWSFLTNVGTLARPVIVHLVALETFLAVLAFVTLYSWNRKLSPTAAAVVIMAAYYFVWLNWFQPWYLLTFMPLMVTWLKSPKSIFVMAGIGIIGLLSYYYTTPIAVGVALLLLAMSAAYVVRAKKMRVNSATRARQIIQNE